MKKSYSNPLMFSSILLSSTPGVGESQIGGIDPFGTTESSKTLGSASPELTIGSGLNDNADASGGTADVQIVDPDQKSEPAVTEESIQSVIDQILGEDTDTVPSDESSLAD